jgi:transposase-like protein
MARGRSLAEFQKSFADESACTAFLFKRRWPDGFVCPACGKRRAVALKSRPRLFECLDCGRQTSITAGTMLHRSKLPLTIWFWAAHLMATHSNGMSALQLEAQLGVTYKTAWLLTQKLRRSMADPNREPLEGVVEVDQTELPFRIGAAFHEPDIAGKILIAGAVEVLDHADNKSKPRRLGAKYLDTRSGRLRLAVIADNSAKSLEAFVRANVKPGATLLTDGHAAYPGLAGDYRHDPRVVGAMAANILLPWSHRAFALMKRWALGTYHGLRRKHVGAYLDEFVFRYNRRFYRHVSFETLLGLAANHEPTSYQDIISREDRQKSRGGRTRSPTTYRRT